MKIKVLLFGILEETVGRNFIEIEGASDTDSLIKKAKETNAVFIRSGFVVAVNKKVITTNQILNENDEIAFLPPFSGG